MRLTTEKTFDPKTGRPSWKIRAVRRSRTVSEGRTHETLIGQVTKDGGAWKWRRLSLGESKWTGEFATMREAVRDLSRAVK